MSKKRNKKTAKHQYIPKKLIGGCQMCYPASFIQTIQRLYFREHKKIKEIAESLNCSTDTVSRIIKKDERYKTEKELRRNNTKEKQKNSKKEKRKEDNRILESLKRQQEKHAILMSRKRKLSTDALIELAITHYKYDKEHKQLVFTEDFGERPSDLPRTVKVHKDVLNEFRKYAQSIESEKFNSSVEQKALT
jgi:IS30 family transposase